MSTKRKKRANDTLDRYIERMISEYVAATGDTSWTRIKVAEWAIANNKWKQREVNALKELARTISRVAGKATFIDDDGNEVRKWHAWRLGDGQMPLWSDIDVISVENMTYSINARRDKLVNGAIKAIIDAEYFNKNRNPGEPILVETDLTKDVNEKRQPTLYDDIAPEEDGPKQT